MEYIDHTWYLYKFKILNFKLHCILCLNINSTCFAYGGNWMVLVFINKIKENHILRYNTKRLQLENGN